MIEGISALDMLGSTRTKVALWRSVDRARQRGSRGASESAPPSDAQGVRRNIRGEEGAVLVMLDTDDTDTDKDEDEDGGDGDDE